MNSQMTDLALAGKWGFFGARGSVGPSGVASPSCASSDPSASIPKPLPARARNWRREAKAGDGGANSLGTFMSRLSSAGLRNGQSNRLDHVEPGVGARRVRFWQRFAPFYADLRHP